MSVNIINMKEHNQTIVANSQIHVNTHAPISTNKDLLDTRHISGRPDGPSSTLTSVNHQPEAPEPETHDANGTMRDNQSTEVMEDRH